MARKFKYWTFWVQIRYIKIKYFEVKNTYFCWLYSSLCCGQFPFVFKIKHPWFNIKNCTIFCSISVNFRCLVYSWLPLEPEGSNPVWQPLEGINSNYLNKLDNYKRFSRFFTFLSMRDPLFQPSLHPFLGNITFLPNYILAKIRFFQDYFFVNYISKLDFFKITFCLDYNFYPIYFFVNYSSKSHFLNNISK